MTTQAVRFDAATLAVGDIIWRLVDDPNSPGMIVLMAGKEAAFCRCIGSGFECCWFFTHLNGEGDKPFQLRRVKREGEVIYDYKPPRCPECHRPLEE